MNVVSFLTTTSDNPDYIGVVFLGYKNFCLWSNSVCDKISNLYKSTRIKEHFNNNKRDSVAMPYVNLNILLFPSEQKLNTSQGRLIFKASRSHTMTNHRWGTPLYERWVRHPFLRRDSNSQYQQAIGLRPSP